MKIAGFTIIRNAVKYDYPVWEAIQSVLPLCDAFFVGVGKSEDETRKIIEGIASDKIKVIDTVWDESMREGGLLLSHETNKIFDLIPQDFDWCFYIQSDECLHEDDMEKIKISAKENLENKTVDGLLFSYQHFYGSYDLVGEGRRWYRKEIRIIRNDKNIRSWKDAQGFRKKDGSKLRVKDCGAFIYHYGWVKPPKAQQAKQENFHKMWHNDEWMKQNIEKKEEFDYSQIDLLQKFSGTHPAVMKKRIEGAHWKFNYDRSKAKITLKMRLLHFIEKNFKWRLGENKNYTVV